MKALAGIVLNPAPGTSMAFTDEGTLIVHPGQPPRLLLPNGEEVSFAAGDPVAEVLVSKPRFWFFDGKPRN